MCSKSYQDHRRTRSVKSYFQVSSFGISISLRRFPLVALWTHQGYHPSFLVPYAHQEPNKALSMQLYHFRQGLPHMAFDFWVNSVRGKIFTKEYKSRNSDIMLRENPRARGSDCGTINHSSWKLVRIRVSSSERQIFCLKLESNKVDLIILR